jgi:hypothetical protein
MEDATGIDPDLTIGIRQTSSVADQPANLDKSRVPYVVGTLCSVASWANWTRRLVKKGPVATKRALLAGTRVKDLDLQPHNAGGGFQFSQRWLGDRGRHATRSGH